MMYYRTQLGKIVHGDALAICKKIKSGEVDLIITSPPYALIRKKAYGNPDQAGYIDWFMPYANEFYRILKPTGSFVLNIGSAWNKGTPTKSIYQFELLICLLKINFYLAQDLYWYNTSKMPSPAEWVTIRRIRFKDAVEQVFWLSKSPYPKATNKKVLVPYSQAMEQKLKTGMNLGQRPSGHTASSHFNKRHKGAIASNLLSFANTDANSSYFQFCKQHNIKPHPARFPELLPRFFIKALTNKYDNVLDPFAGSCTTGQVAEDLKRHWVCIDNNEEYLKGACGRFLTKDDIFLATAVP